jgi:hypothetical protein
MEDNKEDTVSKADNREDGEDNREDKADTVSKEDSRAAGEDSKVGSSTVNRASGEPNSPVSREHRASGEPSNLANREHRASGEPNNPASKEDKASGEPSNPASREDRASGELRGRALSRAGASRAAQAGNDDPILTKISHCFVCRALLLNITFKSVFDAMAFASKSFQGTPL